MGLGLVTLLPSMKTYVVSVIHSKLFGLYFSNTAVIV